MADFDIFAILDTNSVLHYSTPDQINWKDVLGPGRAAIVITHALWDELNAKKERGAPDVRQRAEQREKWLRDRFRSKTFKLREEATLLFEPGRHRIDMAAGGLDPLAGDDHMIAEAKSSMQRRPSARTLIISSDGGLQIRASSHGIETIELPDSARQPIESPLDRENRQLRKELQEAQNRLPRLDLCFADGGQSLRTVVPPVEPLSDAQIAVELVAARRETPLVDRAATRAATFDEGSQRLLLPYGNPYRLHDYNRAVEKYYENLEKYLREGRLDGPLLISLPIELHNAGTDVATRLDAELTLPEIAFFSLLDLTSWDERPSPPRIDNFRDLSGPISSLDPMSRLLDADPMKTVRDQARLQGAISGRVGPDIETQDGVQKVVLKRPSLSHAHFVPIPLSARFRKRSLVRSFQIRYWIHSDSIPRPLEGDLNVVIENDRRGG